MAELRPLNVNLPTKRILIIGPAWVGDMVMAQSLFITLKQINPDCLIDVLAPAWSAALLERMPEVNQAIALPLGHGQLGLNIRIKLGRELRGRHYQQAIVLPNSWKSTLTPFFADIPCRTGYVGELRWGLLTDARRLSKTLLPMTVQRFVALGLPAAASLPPVYPYPKLIVSPTLQAAVCAKFGVTSNSKILAICPGAEYGPAKRWPAGHFAAVARQKHQAGWKIWLFGSGNDREVAAEIQALTGGLCTDFTGNTSLAQAVDLLSLATVVLSNDSGLMHVAAALDKKVIALYGSSDPGFTPPLHPEANIISMNLDCAPCFKRVCPLGHTRCLTDLSPAMVLAAIQP